VTEIVNLLELDLKEHQDEGRRFHTRSVSRDHGAEKTGFTVYELAPGEGAWPYHYELTEEEWLIVVAGEVTLRAPDGDRVLQAGDATCFPIGPEGAHQLRNESQGAARFAMQSSRSEAYVAIRPDSKTAYVEGPGFFQIVPLDESLDYWDREP
jgi:uncharacterized cupin superfamily protein